MTDLINVLKDFVGSPPNFVVSEADTRAVIIDRILQAAGWQAEEIQREPYAGWKGDRGYIDYLLQQNGKPFMVIEAKKTARSFTIPDSLRKAGTSTLGKVRAVADPDLIEALDQCSRYTRHCGAVYALASNGIDFIFFKPFHPFRSEPDAHVVIFSGYKDALSRYDDFEKLIDAKQIRKGFIEKALVGTEIAPLKFSHRLREKFPRPTGRSPEVMEFSLILDRITRDFLIDIQDEEAFDRCYVRVPWARTTNDNVEAMVTNQVGSIRLADTSVRSEDFLNGAASGQVTQSSVNGRTIVVHGPIGVGKTSFLRQLPRSIVKKTDKVLAENVIWAHLDLLDFRDRPFSPTECTNIVKRICVKLRDRLISATSAHYRNLDPDHWNHLRDVYNKEVTSFKKQRFPDSDDGNKTYLDEVRKYVWELKESDPQEHLVRLLYWLTVTQKVPVILVLDNSDQLGLEFQELLYKLATSIQNNSSAITMLALRTSALSSHRIREHTLATVEERFEVKRASIVEILNRRLAEIKNHIRLSLEVQKDLNVQAAIDRLDALMDTLQQDLDQGGRCAELLDIAGNGNLRRTMEAISYIFKLDPKTMDRLVAEQAIKGRAILPDHYVVRAIMRMGDDSYKSDSEKCLLPNLLDVDEALSSWHCLNYRILRQIQSKTTSDSVPTFREIVSDFSMSGIDPKLVEKTLYKLRQRELITLPHMLEHISDEDSISLTPLSSGLLDVVWGNKAYFDELVWDTPVCDEKYFKNMVNAWRRKDRNNIREAFQELDELFVEYLEENQSEFNARLQEQFLEPAAHEKIDYRKHQRVRVSRSKSRRGSTQKVH